MVHHQNCLFVTNLCTVNLYLTSPFYITFIKLFSLSHVQTEEEEVRRGRL